MTLLTTISTDNEDAAIASLDAPNDSPRVAPWIRRFLKA